jgi:hypothetical protein
MRILQVALLAAAANAAETNSSVSGIINSTTAAVKNVVSDVTDAATAAAARAAALVEFKGWLDGTKPKPADVTTQTIDVANVMSNSTAQNSYTTKFTFNFCPSASFGAYTLSWNIVKEKIDSSMVTDATYGMFWQMKSTAKAAAAKRLLQTATADYDGWMGFWKVPKAVGTDQKASSTVNWDSKSDYMSADLKLNKFDFVVLTERKALNYFSETAKAANRSYTDTGLTYEVIAAMDGLALFDSANDIVMQTRLAYWKPTTAEGNAPDWKTQSSATLATSLTFKLATASSATALMGAAVASLAAIAMF